VARDVERQFETTRARVDELNRQAIDLAFNDFPGSFELARQAETGKLMSRRPHRR
jgi:hypothetical protein